MCMWTSPQGNVYFNLAHQYIAAQLNMLDGADGSAITTAFSSATTLFNTYTDEQVAALQGQDRQGAAGPVHHAGRNSWLV